MSDTAAKRELYDRARDRLRDRLLALANVNISAGGGAEPWIDNLAPGVSAAETEAAYAADPAWAQDLALPHSSAALTVNLLAPWRTDLDQLCFGGPSGFVGLRFEVEAALGLEGAPAFFDALGTSDKGSVGIEVKCLEYLSDPSEKYRVGFEQSIRRICEAHGQSAQGWLGQASLLSREPQSYRALFAHQLVKQAFALSHRREAGDNRLLYLFWEPLDWKRFEFFRQHRRELDRLGEAVVGERITFQYQSVSELLDDWSRRSRPSWLSDHAKFLRRRYDVALDGT